MAKHFLKLKSLTYMSKISVSYCPFDETARGARYVLRTYAALSPSLRRMISPKRSPPPAAVRLLYRKRSLTSPYCPHRNFLIRVRSGKALYESNPKCEIVENIKEDRSSPTVELTYEDGSVDLVEASNVRWKDLVERINDKRARLEFADYLQKAEKFKKER